MKPRAAKTAVSQRVAVILLGLTISLGACNTPSNTAPTNTPNPITTANLEPTATLAPTIAPTVTALPTSTLLPTTSPTGVVNTPANSGVGVCPLVKPRLVPNFGNALSEPYETIELEEPVLDFLNQGGSPEVLTRLFQMSRKQLYIGDLTGDGVPEIGVFDYTLHVLGCMNGQYAVFLEIEYSGNPSLPQIFAVKDMNLDGNPEVVIYSSDSCGFLGHCSSVGIYKWNGQTLQPISKMPGSDSVGELGMRGPFGIELKDIDGNGTVELLLEGGITSTLGDYYEGLPWRIQTDIYMWNGSYFEFHRTTFTAPEYRFQAVQDGDEATRWGEYEKALGFYQEAISSDKLEWWSAEEHHYQIDSWFYKYDQTATPLPKPTPDIAEYPSLAAYARFRIMLLHVKQGHVADAKNVYDTQQQKFRVGTAGHAYAEMAEEFWQSYATNNNLGAACAKAINFAQTYPLEVLTYLGNLDDSISGNYDDRYYHGKQSYVYKPEDVCPFK